ncbi:MAG TPA: DGQHR domain-containing protein [Candidatus Acidoferrales bacterium]|nr:DGQHR domain-containing protein [Candidatus Acidoferrales bacterium]
MADGHNVELLSLNSRGVRVPESVTDKILRYSVSLVSQGRHKFYTFTMPSDILAKTCFVSTRDADPQSGFQRLLDPARAQQIADYIDAGLGTIPSSIVLSAQPEAELRVIGGGKTIEFKSTKRSFLILDGQHRVWGFKLAKTALRVPVVVYNNLTRKDESRLFIDINTKQRPVPNELLLDIKKLAEYENTTEELSGKVFDLFNTETDSPLLGLLSSAERVKGKISRVTFYLCCLETSDSNICK